MSGRVYEVRTAPYRAPAGATVADRVWANGVCALERLIWCERFGADLEGAWSTALGDGELAIALPLMLERGASMRDVGRLAARWLRVATRETGAWPSPQHAALVSAALKLCEAEAPDAQLAYDTHLALIGAKLLHPRGKTHGEYFVVQAAARAVGLVGRRVQLGGGGEAELAGEMIRELLDRQLGYLGARPVLAELAELARAATRPEAAE